MLTYPYYRLLFDEQKVQIGFNNNWMSINLPKKRIKEKLISRDYGNLFKKFWWAYR